MFLLELKLELDFLEAYLKFWEDPSGYKGRYPDTKKAHSNTLGKNIRILKEISRYTEGSSGYLHLKNPTANEQRL